MKKITLIAILTCLVATANAAVDTKAIEQAKTLDDVKAAYQTAADELIKNNNGKISDEEIKSARNAVSENISAVDAAVADGTIDEIADATDDTADQNNASDDTKPSAETTTKSGKTGGPKPPLSEEDSKAQIEELRANAQAMKNKEQSTANKLIGAAGIGATGIGGMQMASAMAEQNADNAAEADMTAYLATFKCDYGMGKTINGGDTEIILPGGNELFSLRQEYIRLATDLKTRKETLGLAAGIESEVILDKANTGLYEDVGTGKTDGAYTSLARALSDSTSADAAEWNAQKSETVQQLKTGATVAGIGAAGSLIANLAVNSGAKKQNKSDEIIAKYDAKRTVIRQALAPIEQESKTTATKNPPATEDNKEPAPQISPDQMGCEQSGGTWANNKCTCGMDKPVWDAATRSCKQAQNMLVDDDNDEEIPPAPRPVLTLYNQSLFDSGKTEIKQPATKLDETIKTLKTQTQGETDFQILLVAHTDRDRIKQNVSLCTTRKICTNDALGAARGESVREYILDAWPELQNKNAITIQSAGDKCATGTTAADKAMDRKVDFYIAFDGENWDSINQCETNDMQEN